MFIGGTALTVAGLIIIPQLLEKYSNKMYKSLLKKEKIDLISTGQEIVMHDKKKKENKRMAIDIDKNAQEAINAIADKIKNLKTLNIIVAGKTGVGKSTLINAVFREKLAETGMGKPVTDHMCKITKKGISLAIYDTRGFELSREVQTEVKKEVIDTISK